MKQVSELAFQGDVMFRRVDEVPSGLKQKKEDGTPLIVAHSETGHHHVVEGGKVKLYEQDASTCFLRIEGTPADVVHKRPHDTHETLRLTPGIWEVRRQREWTPEGWRQVAD